jgi:chromosome segregation ATPase
MLEEFRNQLDQQQQTLIELEDELEMEISRVIALKNKIDAELIEDLEKIEEGLYVEVKMINETKKNVDTILKTLKDSSGKEKDLAMIGKDELEKIKAEVEKFKKRNEKLAKQLIEANDEIEEMNSNMEKKLKDHESELKNELITKLKDKDSMLNEKLIEAQKREEELLKEMEKLRKNDVKGSGEVGRAKEFFEKKIEILKTNMKKEYKDREKNIAEKAIVAFNKKKEKIYNSIIKEILMLPNRPPEIDSMLATLRVSLDLADDVYGLENFSTCDNCESLIHITQNMCPGCQAKIVWQT